jgi:hypothetical protein
MQRIIAVCGFILLGMAASSPAAEFLHDPDLGLRMALPDGFTKVELPEPERQKFKHAYLSGDPQDAEPDMMIIVEPMPKPIGRERLRPEMMPPGFAGRLSTKKWKAFDVDTLEVPETINGVDLLTINVQVPLRPRAVQLKFVGSASRRDELHALAESSLLTVDGETNWIGSGFQGAAMTRSENYKYVLMTLAAIIVIGGLIGLMIVSRRSPRGTVLGLSAAIWLLGQSMRTSLSREAMVVSGSLSMLGFAGVLLGLFDFFRRRQTPRKPATKKSDASNSSGNLTG